MAASTSPAALLATATVDMPKYEALYKHFHANPELSDLEEQTAKKCAEELAKFGAFKITTNIGGHGVAGVFENGAGNTILLRSDMDALPVQETTGLPYASTVNMADVEGNMRPVMHACGHDVHMTCLLAAADALVQLKDHWKGTLVVVFQPAEERGTGAQAMVDDGLYEKHNIPVPDYALGQHVIWTRAGSVSSCVGPIMASADSMKITISGRGGHGSQPHRTIDPVVMAAHIVVRLQSIVSREMDPSDISVLTVGSLQAGHTENIIVDTAEIGVDIRSVKEETREQLLAAIRRVVDAECQASAATAPPVYKVTRHFPLTSNDEGMMKTLSDTFKGHFGDAYDPETPTTTASEDFSVLATAKNRPSVFWHFGGTEQSFWDQKAAEGRIAQDVPANHKSTFAPVIDPTLRTGMDCMILAALTFLQKN